MGPHLRQYRWAEAYTSILSGILIQPAFWPQQTWAKIWRAVSFWEGELRPHLIQCGRGGAEAYLRAKFHLDTSNRLATIHQRHRQTGQTDRQTDSMGRKVLQPVAQKLKLVMIMINAKRL